jgi:hypothetical protein
MGEEIVLEDALAIIPEALRTNYDYVTSYMTRLQTKLDQKAKIGLKPLTAPFDADRAAGLAEAATVSSPDLLKSQIMNFSMHTVDESMQMTAESRNNDGLEVLVSRKYDDVGVHNRKDPCQWCIDRECDQIPYQEAYEMGVFERHDGCECLITYTNERGDTTYQSAKGAWYESTEEALEKLRHTIRSLIVSSTEDTKDLLDLCIDVIYHDKMKAYGLRNLIEVYKEWKQ